MLKLGSSRATTSAVTSIQGPLKFLDPIDSKFPKFQFLTLKTFHLTVLECFLVPVPSELLIRELRCHLSTS